MSAISVEKEPICKTDALPVINSFNEWDLLEEVIVGVVEGAVFPSWHKAIQATMPEKHWDLFQMHQGTSFPFDAIKAAHDELEEFVNILEGEGVTVRRPEPLDHAIEFSTPDWKSQGLYQAMPRDLLLVVGNEIIETPLAWRCRYFEIHSYRKLLKEYFHAGAKWSAAPKPQLSDDLYVDGYCETRSDCDKEYVINDFEPTFDAADFTRCGKDLFVQKSNVTNSFGIEWLKRHLGSQFRIHEIEVEDSHPMHIDASFVPLAPGHLLINPDRIKTLPDMFRSWNIIRAPQSCIPDSHPLYMSSKWLSLNIFMIDEKRVVVEENEQPLIDLFKKNGFQPILCPFRNFNSFGGSFHCATLDIRRKGGLQSYF